MARSLRPTGAGIVSPSRTNLGIRPGIVTNLAIRALRCVRVKGRCGLGLGLG